MKPLNAGTLRHRITIQQAQDTQNSYGEPVPTWITFATVWASIEPLSGRELSTYRSIGGTETHKVTMRYLSGLDLDTMQISYNNRTFSINSISNTEERNYELVLTCTEYVKEEN